MQCPKCGALVTEQAHFCEKCGFMLRVPTPASPKSDEQPRQPTKLTKRIPAASPTLSKKRRLQAVGIISGILLLTIAVAIIQQIDLGSSDSGSGAPINSTITRSSSGNEAFNKGLEYYRAGEINLAEQNYKLAISQNPKMVHAYLNLGTIYINKNLIDEAEAMTNKCIEVVEAKQDPSVNDSSSGHVLSIAYNNLGCIESRRSKQVSQTGDFSTSQNHAQKAFAHFCRALDLDPTNANAQTNLENIKVISSQPITDEHPPSHQGRVPVYAALFGNLTFGMSLSEVQELGGIYAQGPPPDYDGARPYRLVRYTTLWQEPVQVSIHFTGQEPALLGVNLILENCKNPVITSTSMRLSSDCRDALNRISRYFSQKHGDPKNTTAPKANGFEERSEWLSPTSRITLVIYKLTSYQNGVAFKSEMLGGFTFEPRIQ